MKLNSKFNIVDYLKAHENTAVYVDNEQESRELWNLLTRGEEGDNPLYYSLYWTELTQIEAYSVEGQMTFHDGLYYYRNSNYKTYRYKDLKNKCNKKLY